MFYFRNIEILFLRLKKWYILKGKFIIYPCYLVLDIKLIYEMSSSCIQAKPEKKMLLRSCHRLIDTKRSTYREPLTRLTCFIPFKNAGILHF